MSAPLRVRKPAAPFRRVVVGRVESLTPWMLRVTLTGAELADLPVGLPTGNIRLLLPPDGSAEVVLPAWNGNEFLYDGGVRPTIRSFTPRRYDEATHELDVDIVIHEGGAVSGWAQAAVPGAPIGVSGTGRGYPVAADAGPFLFGGDESALPAIGVLLEVLPASATVLVLIEIAHPDARLPLPPHPGATVRWYDLDPGAAHGDALHGAFVAAEIEAATRIWVAGEAASVQRIRRHLFEDRGVPRSHAFVRGYWKHGRAGSDPDATSDDDDLGSNVRS